MGPSDCRVLTNFFCPPQNCMCVRKRFLYIFTVLLRCIIPCSPIVCVLRQVHRPAGTLNNYLLGSQTSVTVTRGHPPPPSNAALSVASLSNNIENNVVTLYEGI
jgi:hypothetical protein